MAEDELLRRRARAEEGVPETKGELSVLGARWAGGVYCWCWRCRSRCRDAQSAGEERASGGRDGRDRGDSCCWSRARGEA